MKQLGRRNIQDMTVNHAGAYRYHLRTQVILFVRSPCVNRDASEAQIMPDGIRGIRHRRELREAGISMGKPHDLFYRPWSLVGFEWSH